MVNYINMVDLPVLHPCVDMNRIKRRPFYESGFTSSSILVIQDWKGL